MTEADASLLGNNRPAESREGCQTRDDLSGLELAPFAEKYIGVWS